MRKKITTVALTTLMAMAISVPAFAAQWQSDANGWWYQYDDGSYPANTWQWIDGNGDGMAESYYFNEQGYCLINTTTPDGYTVNPAGAWTVNGIVQIKAVENNSQPKPVDVEPINLMDMTPTDSRLCSKFENLQTNQGVLWSSGYKFITASTNYIEFNADGKYNKFTATMTVAKANWASANFTISVYGDDDTVLYTKNFTNSDDPFNIDADISGQHKVKIAISGDAAEWILMKNPQFK